MILDQMSVSRATVYDPKQKGGCPRRFWFEVAQGLKPEQKDSQSDGEKGHALFANWFERSELPAKRVKMGKAVTGAIVKGDLPRPGPDMIVEERFSGQPKYDARGNWIPLDVSETFHFAGLPWEGFIDLAFRRGDVPEIWDHKFTSDLSGALRADQLIETIQMPIYVLSQVPFWPDAKHWRIVHHNVSRTGTESTICGAVVSLERVRERGAEIATLVDEMKLVAQAPAQTDVPFNRRSCDAYGGCPHQSICAAFRTRNQVELTTDEQELFNQLDAIAPPPPPAVEQPKTRRLDIKCESEPLPEDAAKAAKAQTAPAAPACKCGAAVTPENGSKLQSGEWKHVGCPLDKPAPIAPPDAPASKPELASEQPPAPKERKPRAPKAPPAAPVTPEMQAVVRAPPSEPKPLTEPPGVVTHEPAQAPDPRAFVAGALSSIQRSQNVADVLEAIARLIRN